MRSIALALALATLLVAGVPAAITSEDEPSDGTGEREIRDLVFGGVFTEPSVNGPTGGNLENPFDSPTGPTDVGQTTWEDYMRAFPPQPMLDTDGNHYLMGREFQWVWDNAAPEHRRQDPQTGDRQVFQSTTGHWVRERAPTSTPSTPSTTDTTTEGQTPPQEFHVPWPIPTAVGEVHFGQLTDDDNPPPDLPSTIPQTQRGYRAAIGTYQCQAGQRISLDVWAQFDCVVYLVGPDGQVVAANNDFDVMARNHSRLENVVIPTSGGYRVVITSDDPDTTGRFWLSLGGNVPPTR